MAARLSAWKAKKAIPISLPPWLKHLLFLPLNNPVRLTRDFFAQPTLQVARGLLGKELVFADKVIRLTEVEAYIGQDDPACHACRGMTPRNKPMFGPPGFSYVYLIYGMYHCLNLVTEDEGFPAAVLIRAAEVVSGLPKSTNLNGPGRLTKHLGLTKAHNNLDLCVSHSPLYLQDSGFTPERITASSRIGIKKGTDLLWRFNAY